MEDLIPSLLNAAYIGIGIAIGISIGIAVGKKQKPWSEMTEAEKRTHMYVIATGVVILIIGVLVNLWLFFRGGF